MVNAVAPQGVPQHISAVVDVETTGLHPLDCRITAIGVSFLDGSPIRIFTDKNEESLLKEFWKIMAGHNVERLIGFNLEFDWSFIKLRSMKYGIKVPHFRKYEGRLDLQALLNSYSKKGKLTEYCDFFGIEHSHDDLKGSEMPKLWTDFEIGNDYQSLEKIIVHLTEDVKRTAKLFEIVNKLYL